MLHMARPTKDSRDADEDTVPPGMLEVAQSVLGSITFSRSLRLRDFLSFVVKCSVENRPHEVNEYSLGVGVFGRSPNFDPKDDNIVRVTARLLRVKLAEYYAGEGSSELWRLEIPKGSYLPILQPNLPAAVETVHQPLQKHRWLIPLLAILAAAGWGYGAWTSWRAPRVQLQEAYLLAPLLTDKSRPLTIVFDDPLLGYVWQKVGGVMPLNQFVAGRYLDKNYYAGEAGAFLRGQLEDKYLVQLSTLQAMTRISDVARSHGVETTMESCRTLSAEKLKDGNFVFVGGVGGNPWVGEIQTKLAFEQRVDPVRDLRTFVNRSPRPGEPALFQANPGLDNTGVGFTRVAVLKNTFGAGKIALLGGFSRGANQAATQFALSRAGHEQVQRLCGAPAEKLSGFELILEIKALGIIPVTGTIAADRCGAR